MTMKACENGSRYSNTFRLKSNFINTDGQYANEENARLGEKKNYVKLNYIKNVTFR